MPVTPPLTLQELRSMLSSESRLLCSASLTEQVQDTLQPATLITTLSELSPGINLLVVVGGGRLMDEAKAWRVQQSPDTRLIAIPGLWGSGAEVSPVAVLKQNGKKKILIGPEYVPDAWVIWPELSATLPYKTAFYGCGDAWSHALEGFLSPLADKDLRCELANVIDCMLDLPLANDPHWFLPSAQACEAQSRSSVGLIHGIAHTLEGPLQAQQPDAGWGHAKLCSIFLWPVMQLNRSLSDKWDQYLSTHNIDSNAVMQVLRELHDPVAYTQAMPLLAEQWMTISRDPSTRVNSSLVRPRHKSWFIERAFQ